MLDISWKFQLAKDNIYGFLGFFRFFPINPNSDGQTPKISQNTDGH